MSITSPMVIAIAVQLFCTGQNGESKGKVGQSWDIQIECSGVHQMDVGLGRSVFYSYFGV
jgi:hypothetical protein